MMLSQTVAGQLVIMKEGHIMDHRWDLQIPKTAADGKVFLPANYIIYCSICGDVWGERQVFHENAGRYWAKDKPCRHCGHGFIWEDYDEAWNKSLPLPVLVREIELIHNFYTEGAKNIHALFPPKSIRRQS